MWARAKMWSGGRTYYSANSEPLGFQTRSPLDPDPPTGFRAQQIFYNRAEVRWWAPSHTGHGPLSRYTIHARRWDAENSRWTAWGNAGNPNANASSYTVTGYCDGGSHSWCPAENFANFEPGTHYQLRIEARNRIGTDDSTVRGSAWSEILSIQTISPVPVAPDKPRISELEATSVKVHWDSLTNDGADEVYSWAVQTRQPKQGGGFTEWTTMESPNHDDQSAVQSVVLTGLTPSTYNHNTDQYQASHYQVRVWARARTCDTCKIFYSPGSDERGFDMRTLGPSAPEAPVLSNPQTQPQRIDVTWQPPDWMGQTGTINHDDVYVLADGTWHDSRPKASTATSLELAGYHDGTTERALQPGTDYRVRVRGVGREVVDGTVTHYVGAWSAPSGFLETLPGALGAPDAPTVSQIGSGSATVSWSAPSFAGATAIHDYDVEIRQRQADGTWGGWASSHGAVHGTGTSATFTGLNPYGGGDGDVILFSPSTDYQVRVRANNQERNDQGDVTNTRRGTWSPATAFRTAADAPTGLFVIPGDGEARVVWEQPEFTSGEAGFRYVVQHAGNEQFTGAGTAETTAGSIIETHAGERAVPGDWALVPAGVEEGQRFRLLFVTSGETMAQSDFISTYNTFVQNAAAGGHQAIQGFSGEFRALVSTDTVHARDNTGTAYTDADDRGVPIYWVNGDKVADDYADFYDGGWDSNAPRTETGADAGSPTVSTGSGSDGTTDDGVGGGSSTTGMPATAGQELDTGGGQGNFLLRPLYGLSPVLVAGSAAPPTELTVTGLTNGTETRFRVRAVRRSGGTDFPGDWSDSDSATPMDPVDYDADDDGLIEISNLAQLNAVRWDLNGRGQAAQAGEIGYAFAFPVPMDGMGCPPVQGDAGGCRGYELAADLDFDENGDGDRNDTYNQGNGWLPIGDPGNAEDDDPETYGGVFDGNGRTISNLYINRGADTRAGLFDGIRWGAVVRDLGLPDVNVTGGDTTGALAGINLGTVRRAWTTGSVTGNGENTGGLVGYNRPDDLIVDSWSSSTVSGQDNTGGLVGYNERGIVRDSYASGTVSAAGRDYIGGLVGSNEGGTIERSYATGAVSGQDRLGGLVGHNTGSVTDSYASGSVSGTGDDRGGLVGWNEGGSVLRSYAVGLVSGTGDSVNGLIGFNEDGTVTASYWDTQKSGHASGGLGTGKTTAQLQSPTSSSGIYDIWSDDLVGLRHGDGVPGA